ncbi:hypothetical protein CEE60_09935 [Stenotrophomonas maltophilia]|uniref:Transmembrane protein n=1 Tax=Stenotrophomonas maltophilia TaxID=40324 RepID=A0A246HMS1_STEMA|nr:hypothetical protein CEE60_09935 [Stenotrophomonas maltophilia]
MFADLHGTIFFNTEGGMAIVICPLEAAWGNWADWAGVIAGLAAAGGTIWVALLARRTSEKSVEIAGQAKEIAQQQHQEAVDLRDAQARILSRRLRHEVVELLSRIAGLLSELDEAVSFEGLPRVENGGRLMRMLDAASMPLLPGARAVEDRIHNLPDELGSDLAVLIGGDQTLEERIKSIRGRFSRPNPQGSWTYAGSSMDFLTLKHHLEWMLRLGASFAPKFITFDVGNDS